jgi:CBS domain-containing protein
MDMIGTVDAILKQKGSGAFSIGPDATVFDAIQMMSDRNVGALMVMENDRLIGIISERDYTRKVALKGKVSKQTSVREILSGKIVNARPDSTVEECMRAMTEHRIRHLPVVEADKVVGVISIGDLVNWIISAQSATIDQLHSYITGQYHG